MQSKLNKSLVKKEEYQTQFPTLQDWLTIIKADIEYLQAKRIKLEVGYQKVEINLKSLELVIAMDVHELIIAIEQTKHLKKENDELNIRLHPQVDDLKESIETIKCLQFCIQ